jgi:hypothetical protein
MTEAYRLTYTHARGSDSYSLHGTHDDVKLYLRGLYAGRYDRLDRQVEVDVVDISNMNYKAFGLNDNCSLAAYLTETRRGHAIYAFVKSLPLVRRETIDLAFALKEPLRLAPGMSDEAIQRAWRAEILAMPGPG